nr:serine/threonine/dual specificity protein kinase, catalytic domain-containing protein [Tanacetum cinerariifolium]
MDPNYFYTGRLTIKSDVYAFGVVLLEVLCGRPALDESLDEGLAVWAQDHIKQGKVSQITDPNLKDHISKSSLKEFSRIAARCLLSNPNKRPTMSDVVASLDLALSIQERKDSSTQGGILRRKAWSILSLKGYFEIRSPGGIHTPESKETNGDIVSVPVPTLGMETLGYQIHDMEATYYADGEDVYDMRKQLKGKPQPQPQHHHHHSGGCCSGHAKA